MISSVLFAIGLLLSGFVLRAVLKPFQWLHVPASIVGGLAGLAIVQLISMEAISVRIPFATSINDLVANLKSWPGTLIAIVFAGMFLTKPSGSSGNRLRKAGQEGIVVWIIVLGQTAIGLLCTWLLIQPFFDVPNSFAMLIETGFAGGHGTAAAMGTVLESETVNLANGLDLGLFMATIGLLFSVLSGIAYVNLAIRMGWIRGKANLLVIHGLEARKQPECIARGTVKAEAIDPLVFQILLLGVAFGIGWTVRESIVQIAQMADAQVQTSVQAEAAREALRTRTSFVGTIGDFPLFIYTLFGGWFVRRLLSWLRLDDLIDNLSIQRLTGIAMDFLIVSAIVSLRVEAISDVATPLLILLAAAFIWTGFCLLFVARQLLPKDYWFELGILNYGMSTGTTATGFTLLKIVDGDLASGAAEDYALAAPLSAPFIGGGMLTIGLPLLVLESVHIAVPAIVISSVVVMLFLIGLRTRSN